MLSNQEKLVEILRHKGIGPEGSKSLGQENLLILNDLLKSTEVSKTTISTLLTALLTLEPNPLEALFIEDLKKNYTQIIPSELFFFFEKDRNEFQELIIQTINKKNLDEAECQKAMEFCFDSETPTYLIAAFLEAQRLKRESFTENSSFYKFFLATRNSVQIDLASVVDLCDSYDGVKRNPNFSVFTACVLAALGINVCLHGLESVAPKHGLTTYQLLKAAGKSIPETLEESTTKILDNNIGWTFVHLKAFFPELYRISEMRTEMVKRPFLATFEKLLSPIQATGKNFLVSPYTHKHYKDEVVNLLKEFSPVNGFIHLKGLEATSQPNPVRKSEITVCMNGNPEEQFISPEDFGLSPLKKNPEFLEVADLIKEGLKTLKGEQNEASTLIKYQACMVLTSFFGYSNTDSIEKVNTAISSGEALKRWEGF